MSLIGHPGMKAQASVAMHTSHLISMALSKEANATLIVLKQNVAVYQWLCKQGS